MPNADTFKMKPVSDLLDVTLGARAETVDPFSRTSMRAKWRNDLDPSFGHEFSLDAVDFAAELTRRNVRLDGVYFDPPYSPRQISECYRGVGRTVGTAETQSGALYSSVRDLLSPLCNVGTVAVSFGWNTAGFGLERGWALLEVMLLCHGSAHNDTIIVVEQKTRHQADLFGGTK